MYDLSTDRAEQNDPAAEHPDRVCSMAAIWEEWKDRFIREAGDPASARKRQE